MKKALKEIKEAKSDDINSILDKYKFKHSSLKNCPYRRFSFKNW